MAPKPKPLGHDILHGADPSFVPAQDNERPRLGEVLAQASVADLSESPLEWIWAYREAL